MTGLRLEGAGLYKTLVLAVDWKTGQLHLVRGHVPFWRWHTTFFEEGTFTLLF